MKKLITLLFTGFIISATSAQWNPNTDQNLSVVNYESHFRQQQMMEKPTSDFGNK